MFFYTSYFETFSQTQQDLLKNMKEVRASVVVKLG